MVQKWQYMFLTTAHAERRVDDESPASTAGGGYGDWHPTEADMIQAVIGSHERKARVNEVWFSMLSEAGLDGWEATNFGVDANGNWVFMKRPAPAEDR